MNSTPLTGYQPYSSCTETLTTFFAMASRRSDSFAATTAQDDNNTGLLSRLGNVAGALTRSPRSLSRPRTESASRPAEAIEAWPRERTSIRRSSKRTASVDLRGGALGIEPRRLAPRDRPAGPWVRQPGGGHYSVRDEWSSDEEHTA